MIEMERGVQAEKCLHGSIETVEATGERRIEATRTPDPYVPNVVRYQLRYYPCFLLGAKVEGILELCKF